MCMCQCLFSHDSFNWHSLGSELCSKRSRFQRTVFCSFMLSESMSRGWKCLNPFGTCIFAMHSTWHLHGIFVSNFFPQFLPPCRISSVSCFRWSTSTTRSSQFSPELHPSPNCVMVLQALGIPVSCTIPWATGYARSTGRNLSTLPGLLVGIVQTACSEISVFFLWFSVGWSLLAWAN